MNLQPVSGGHAQPLDASDDLPKTVVRTLSQGSTPLSMDFHPFQQTLLLGLIWPLFLLATHRFPRMLLYCDIDPECTWANAVGTNVGEIGLWDVGTLKRLLLKNFKVWDLGSCSITLQASSL